MTLSILLCDDDQNDLDVLKTNLDQFFFKSPDTFEYHIDTCTSGEELLNLFSQGVYNIVFLDIELSGINGIEVARKLRNDNNSLIIVFVTSYDSFMRASFEVQPFQYIEKPVNRESIRKICLSIIDNLSKTHSYIITIPTALGNNIINIHDLSYIQAVKAHKNTIEFHLKNGTVFVSTGTLLAWEAELKEYGFLQSCRGFLVNIHQVRIITSNQIILLNNEVLPLSRRQYKIIHDTFVNHVISVLK